MKEMTIQETRAWRRKRYGNRPDGTQTEAGRRQAEADHQTWLQRKKDRESGLLRVEWACPYCGNRAKGEVWWANAVKMGHVRCGRCNTIYEAPTDVPPQ